jgi:hypothetical protein
MRGGMRATRTSLPVLPCFHTTWPQRRACPRTTSTITAAGPASTPPVSQRGRPLVLGQHPAPPPPPPSTPLPALGLFGLKWRPTKLGWFGFARSLSLLSSPEDAGLQEGEREGRKAGPGAAATEKVRIFPSLFLLCSYSLALLRECTSLEIGDVRSCGRCSLCSRQSLPLSRWICVADSSALVSGEGSRGSRLIDWSIDWSDGGVPKRANADASIRRIPIGLGEAAK